MSKPPLIRAVKAKGPAKLEIAWSTAESHGGRFACHEALQILTLSHGLKADPPCGGARLRGAEHAMEEARGVNRNSDFAILRALPLTI